MARIRTLKPEFWLSESIARFPFETRLLAIALLNYADDEGYFKAHPSLVKASCFPLDDSMNIPRMLNDLSRDGYIKLGKFEDGSSVGVVVNFLEHQRIDKPSKSKLSCKTIIWNETPESSANPPGVVADDSRVEQGTGKGKERITTLSGKPDDFPPDKKKEMRKSAFEVLAFLNEKAKRNYQPVDANIDPLVARFKEGFSPTVARQVVAKKVREWGTDEKMEQYLRPATLFNKTNFANYAGEIVP